MGVKVTFKNKIPDYVLQSDSKMDQLLQVAATEVYRASQMLVPIAMKNGGTLQQSSIGALKAAPQKYRVSYNTPYARRIHYADREGWVIHAPGRTTRYLEKPMLVTKNHIGELARRMFGQ